MGNRLHIVLRLHSNHPHLSFLRLKDYEDLHLIDLYIVTVWQSDWMLAVWQSCDWLGDNWLQSTLWDKVCSTLVLNGLAHTVVHRLLVHNIYAERSVSKDRTVIWRVEDCPFRVKMKKSWRELLIFSLGEPKNKTCLVISVVLTVLEPDTCINAVSDSTATWKQNDDGTLAVDKTMEILCLFAISCHHEPSF